MIVIDDGSDDRTPEILAGFSHPDLHVLRRNLPEARKGKAQALNAPISASVSCSPASIATA